MKKIIDAEFEVVSGGPVPVRWQPRAKPRPGAGYTVRNNPLSWTIWVMVVGAALYTLFIGLIGGLDSAPPKEQPKHVVIPDGAIAIPPVPHID